MKTIAWVLAAALAVGATGVGWRLWQDECAQARRQIAVKLSGLAFPPYAPQKVVYHVNAGGGLFDGNYRNLLGALKNHLAAVGPGRAELRVVLQGDGLGLLADAAGDASLREPIDALRAAGVRFEVCRNSMVSRGIGPERLYGVTSQDIVQAAVAEIAALEALGFVYMRI
jgi:intracellular sulfur oxidation DsrE/DsrF family protein